MNGHFYFKKILDCLLVPAYGQHLIFRHEIKMALTNPRYAIKTSF